MPISWNEIRHNAIAFSREWAEARSESAEKQSFWDAFFHVFGISRRTVANFEEKVHNLAGHYDRIDLFWPGMLLVEHKSFGGDLGHAESQARDYIGNLVNAGRQDEVPRYVIVSDFARITLIDLEPEDAAKRAIRGGYRIEFPLAELHRHIHEFAFVPGYQQHHFEDQDPINLQAVQIMDDLHDAMAAGGYERHSLERFLVRVLFCLFAEDTGIFERETFRLYIENCTKPDGSDLGPSLARLFDVLNTPPENRQQNLDETLAALPYVNGELFAETLGFANMNRDMRNSLLACTRFDWSQISPAIFGSLFQGVMEPRARRQVGGHYTSERDIMKVIRPLFLDKLREEFERIRGNKNQLRQFHKKLGGLRFLDPACGCGNFLVIAYRELRLLEMEVLTAFDGRQRQLGHPKPFARRHGCLLRHRDRGVAGPHRRGGHVADGSPDEPAFLRTVRPILRAAAAAEEPENRARQRAPPRLGRNPAARTVQLRAGKSAVRGREIPDGGATGRHGHGGGRSEKRRPVGLCRRLVSQGGPVHSRNKDCGRLRVHKLDHPGRASRRPLERRL